MEFHIQKRYSEERRAKSHQLNFGHANNAFHLLRRGTPPSVVLTLLEQLIFKAFKI